MDAFETEVRAERLRQDKKWGPQSFPNGTGDDLDKAFADADKRICDINAKKGTLTWRHVLQEEISKAFAESQPEKLKVELIQCAAVIKAWIEDLERSSIEPLETE